MHWGLGATVLERRKQAGLEAHVQKLVRIAGPEARKVDGGAQEAVLGKSDLENREGACEGQERDPCRGQGWGEAYVSLRPSEGGGEVVMRSGAVSAPGKWGPLSLQWAHSEELPVTLVGVGVGASEVVGVKGRIQESIEEKESPVPEEGEWVGSGAQIWGSWLEAGGGLVVL